MASSTEPTNSNEARFESFIEDRIAQTAQQVRWVDFFSFSLILTIGLLSALFVLCIVDAWIIELQPWMRWSAFGLMIAGSIAFLVIAMFPFLFRRINPLYAAQKIEEGRPELKNSVINYLTTRIDPNRRTEMAVRQKMSQTAAAHVSNIPLDVTVDRSSMIIAGYILAGLVTLFAIYKFASPKDPFQTIGRVILPASELMAPARVKISEIEPKDAQVYFGETLEITAKISGLNAGQFATLLMTTEDGRRVDFGLPMTNDLNDDTFKVVVGKETGGLQQSFTYRIQAGDATTNSYSITVRTCPTIFVESLNYRSPKYTEIPERTVENPNEILGVEGAIVSINARSNLPIEKAYLELFRELPNENNSEPYADSTKKRNNKNTESKINFAKKIPLKTIDETTVVGELTLAMNNKRTRSQYSHYRVSFSTPDGDKSQDMAISKITVINDLPPEIEIRLPKDIEKEIPLDQTEKIEVSAVDPDYRLTKIEIIADGQGTRLFNRVILDSTTSKTGELTGVSGQKLVNFDFAPKAFGLQEGDEVIWYASAEDNRTVGADAILDPNRTRTENFRFKIIAPLNTPGSSDGEQQTGEQKSGEQKSGEQKSGEQKSGEQKSGEQKSGEQKSGEQKSGEQKSGEQKSGEQKSGEQKSGEQKSGEQKSGEQKSGEQKSGEQKSGEQKSGEQKSGEQKSGEQKSGEQKSGEQKSGEQKSGEQKSGEQKSGEQKSGEQKSGEQKSGEQKSGEQKSGEQRPGGQKGRTQKNGSDQKNSGEQKSSQKSDGKKSNSDRKSGDRSQDGNRDGKSRPDESAPRDDSPLSEESGGANGNDNSFEQKRKGKPKNSKEAFERMKDYFDKKKNENNPTRDSDPPSDASEKEKQNAQKNPTQSKNDESKGSDKSENNNQKDSSPNSGNSEKKDSLKEKSDRKKSSGKGESKAEDTKQNQTESDDTKSNSSASETKKKDGKSGNAGKKSSKKQKEGKTESKKLESKRSGDGKAGKNQAGKQSPKDGKNNNPSDDNSKDSDSAKQKPNGNETNDGKASQKNKTGKDGSKNEGSKKGGAKSKQKSNDSEKRPSEDNSNPKKSESGGDTGNVNSSETNQNSDANKKQSSKEQGRPKNSQGEADKDKLKYAKETTDLVLEKLKGQKQDPDADLLKDLNWTKEELQEFTKRWEQMQKKASDGNERDKKAFQNALKSLGLEDPSNALQKQELRDDGKSGYKESSSGRSVPSDFQNQFRAIQKSKRKLKNSDSK